MDNAKKLSDNYKITHGNISWSALSGLRNRIVHDYGNVDLNIIYETLKKDMGQVYVMIAFSIFPVIIVYLFLSKHIVQGVALGSVKG